MLRIFCTAAESRNFKEAATRLGVSPQAVTRAVKELEDHVGELLFHRNTRHNRITEFGEQLAVRARHSLQGVDAVFQRAEQARASELAGLVRITAPRALGRHGLMRVLGELCAQHPGLQLDLRSSASAASRALACRGGDASADTSSPSAPAATRLRAQSATPLHAIHAGGSLATSARRRARGSRSRNSPRATTSSTHSAGETPLRAGLRTA